MEIAKEVEGATRWQRFYAYRNEQVDLPVIRIDSSLPIYRVENYRTRLNQRDWIRDKKVPADYFLSGQENESIQQEQHKCLWKLANERSESVAPINEILIAEGQQEPILITQSGVVVNGNRRLASIREIYKSDPETFGNFSYVDCMVLPGVATEDNLKDIEVKLQMTPNTRLPYDWVSELLAIQDLTGRGRNPEAIASLMGLKDPSKVVVKQRMLGEVDLYLGEWKGKEGQYAEVKDAEQIVTDMTVRFGKKEGIDLEIARRIGWIILDQRGRNGRAYNYKEVVGSLLSDTINKIQETFPNETKLDEPEDNDAELEFDFEQDSVSTTAGVASFLDTAKENDNLQEAILDLCSIVVETRKQARNGQAAFKTINDANTKLLSVELGTADRHTYEGINNQLQSIAQRVVVLLEELQRL